MILAVLMVVALALILVVQGRAGGSRGDWNSGVPVLVTVGAHVGDDTAEMVEYQSTRRWMIAREALRRAGSDAIGTRYQARLVGDCRCQLMLEEPATVPPVLIALVGVGLASTVPGLLARRRWRYQRQVLARPSRPVAVTPVWLRRSLRPAALGVRIAGDAGRSDAVLELVGTPLSWFPQGAMVQLHGPDPRNGLCILAAPGGMAVASAAPRRAEGPLVVPWSDALSVAAGLMEAPPERAVTVGGPGVSRISVSGGGDRFSPPDGVDETVLAYGPARLAKRQEVAGALAYAVALAVVTISAPDVRTAATWLVALGMGLAALARFALARSAARQPPLRTWSDRSAARAAAAAAHGVGLVPSRREAAVPFGSPRTS